MPNNRTAKGGNYDLIEVAAYVHRKDFKPATAKDAPYTSWVGNGLRLTRVLSLIEQLAEEVKHG